MWGECHIHLKTELLCLDPTSWYSFCFPFVSQSGFVTVEVGTDPSECGNVISHRRGASPLSFSAAVWQPVPVPEGEGRDCEEPMSAREGVDAQGPGRSLLAHTYTWGQEGANDGGTCEDDYS